MTVLTEIIKSGTIRVAVATQHQLSIDGQTDRQTETAYQYRMLTGDKNGPKVSSVSKISRNPL